MKRRREQLDTPEQWEATRSKCRLFKKQQKDWVGRKKPEEQRKQEKDKRTADLEKQMTALKQEEFTGVMPQKLANAIHNVVAQQMFNEDLPISRVQIMCPYCKLDYVSGEWELHRLQYKCCTKDEADALYTDLNANNALLYEWRDAYTDRLQYDREHTLSPYTFVDDDGVGIDCWCLCGTQAAIKQRQGPDDYAKTVCNACRKKLQSDTTEYRKPVVDKPQRLQTAKQTWWTTLKKERAKARMEVSESVATVQARRMAQLEALYPLKGSTRDEETTEPKTKLSSKFGVLFPRDTYTDKRRKVIR